MKLRAFLVHVEMPDNLPDIGLSAALIRDATASALLCGHPEAFDALAPESVQITTWEIKHTEISK